MPNRTRSADLLATTSVRREELPRLTFGRERHHRPVLSRQVAHRSVNGRALPRPPLRVVRADRRRLPDVPASHAELLRALPAWSIRLLVSTGIESEVVDAYEAAFREEFATPLHPTVANELRWFYQSADITGESTVIA